MYINFINEAVRTADYYMKPCIEEKERERKRERGREGEGGREGGRDRM